MASGPRIVVACDSFKGTLSSPEVGAIVADELRRALPGCACDERAVGDGGEGTAAAVVDAAGGTMVPCRADDPLGRPVDAGFGMLPGGVCICEMASASGLSLVEPHLRNPLAATSAGFGQLILAALDSGCSELALCIGGTATNDCGMGALRALGARFLDSAGSELAGCGADLARVRAIDLSGLDTRLSRVRMRILSDVASPLLGPMGASRMFAPQKGASEREVEELERGMASFADVLEAELGREVRNLPGAGAAGGAGAALLGVLGAEMASGIDVVLDLIGFDSLLEGAACCVTGEGRLDAQTAQGKVVSGIARRCGRAGVPCHVVAGSVDEGTDTAALGLSCVEGCAGEEFPLEACLADPEAALRAAVRRLASRIAR